MTTWGMEHDQLSLHQNSPEPIHQNTAEPDELSQ